MKVLLGRPFADQDQAVLRASLAGVAEFIQPAAFDDESLGALITDCEVLLGERIQPSWSYPKLRLIQVPWTGTDRLDFETLAQANVPVCNSHSNAMDVAEHAVALALDSLRAVSTHDRSLRDGDWRRPGGDGLPFRPPHRLRDATITIVGYGSIGRAIHALLAGFNVRVLAITRSGKAETAELACEAVGDLGSLLEFAERSTALFVAAPKTPATVGCIDRSVLQALGPTGILVNVGRAELLSEPDLYGALVAQEIAGAGIDVWPTGPSRSTALPSTLAFHELDNVVLSPHRAAFASGALPHLGDAIENIKRLASGRTLINQVDLHAGY